MTEKNDSVFHSRNRAPNMSCREPPSTTTTPSCPEHADATTGHLRRHWTIPSREDTPQQPRTCLFCFNGSHLEGRRTTDQPPQKLPAVLVPSHPLPSETPSRRRSLLATQRRRRPQPSLGVELRSDIQEEAQRGEDDDYEQTGQE